MIQFSLLQRNLFFLVSLSAIMIFISCRAWDYLLLVFLCWCMVSCSLVDLREFHLSTGQLCAISAMMCSHTSIVNRVLIRDLTVDNIFV